MLSFLGVRTEVKPEIKQYKRRASHILALPSPELPAVLVLNDLDFRLCLSKARKEHGKSRRGAEEYVVTMMLYLFRFGSLGNDVTFFRAADDMDAIDDIPGGDDRPVGKVQQSVREFFEKNPAILRSTFDIGLDLVKTRDAANRELGNWETVERDQLLMVQKELEEWDLLEEDSDTAP